MSSLFGAPKVPAPPPIPPPPKIPELKQVDTGKIQKQLAKSSQNNSTILGGYSGSDANVSRPTLLGQ